MLPSTRTDVTASLAPGSRHPFDIRIPLADAGFTESMHEEIIQTLSRLGELTVLSRSTALSLKGTKETLAAIVTALEGEADLPERAQEVRVATKEVKNPFG